MEEEDLAKSAQVADLDDLESSPWAWPGPGPWPDLVSTFFRQREMVAGQSTASSSSRASVRVYRCPRSRGASVSLARPCVGSWPTRWRKRFPATTHSRARSRSLRPLRLLSERPGGTSLGRGGGENGTVSAGEAHDLGTQPPRRWVFPGLRKYESPAESAGLRRRHAQSGNGFPTLE